MIMTTATISDIKIKLFEMSFDFKTTLHVYNRLIRFYESEIAFEEEAVSKGWLQPDPEYLQMVRCKLEKIRRKKDKLLNGQKLEPIS